MPHLIIDLGRLLDGVGDFLAEQLAVALPEPVHRHLHRTLSHLRRDGDFRISGRALLPQQEVPELLESRCPACL